MDEVGDIAVWPGVVGDVGHQHDAIDVVAVAMERLEGDVRLTLELVALPPTGAATDFSYRYWIGFRVSPPGGEVEFMDMRIHDYPYTEGRLISSQEQGLELLGTYPVHSNGTTWTVRFPLDVVQELYGGVPVAVGAPEAQADGPHPQAGVQSTTYIDYNFWEETFTEAKRCGLEEHGPSASQTRTEAGGDRGLAAERGSQTGAAP